MLDGSHHADSADSAFTFEGNWQDFARIALPNLLLTIVTLGIYRFWATARERRYLWSRTRFVDEHLEWAGTGMELFAGFVIVLVLFGGAKLPKLARSLGQAQKEFRDGVKDGTDADDDDS